jgi:hypothetical protein
MDEFWQDGQEEANKEDTFIARLEANGFEWDPHRAQWNQMFEKLKEYQAVTGHCYVPKVRVKVDWNGYTLE